MSVPCVLCTSIGDATNAPGDAKEQLLGETDGAAKEDTLSQRSSRLKVVFVMRIRRCVRKTSIDSLAVI